MSQSHHHSPSHFHDKPNARDLKKQTNSLQLSFILISGFMLIEVIGGFLTNSLALLSDAGHMLSDAAALGATLLAFKIGEKAANRDKTYGYKRFEILVAGANGATLIIISGLIIYEAIERFLSPPEVASTGMLVIASVGFIINLLVAWLLHKGGAHVHADGHQHSDNNLNMHSAYLHVLGDLLGSIAAIIAALSLILFNWAWADPIASIIVAILILISGYRVVKASTHILMEGTPKEISTNEVSRAIKSHAQVVDMHDLHIWTITSGIHALSCHVIVDDDIKVSDSTKLIMTLEKMLNDLGISHSTIQVEGTSHIKCEHCEIN